MDNLKDKFIANPIQRWGVAGLLVLGYLIRVILIGGFYMISYAFAVYLLHLGIHFLIPQGMPQSYYECDDDDNSAEKGSLPMQTALTNTLGNTTNNNATENHQERGLLCSLIVVRKEFKLWKKVTLAAILSLVCTSTRVIDIPVYWPVLLLYFLIYAAYTVIHKIKYYKKYKEDMQKK